MNKLVTILIAVIIVLLVIVAQCKCQTYSLTHACGDEYGGACKKVRGFILLSDSTAYIKIFYGESWIYPVEKVFKVKGQKYYKLVGGWSFLWVEEFQDRNGSSGIITINRRSSKKRENRTWYRFKNSNQ